MSETERRKRIIIMGAGGREFHNFNVLFRDDPGTRVVAFTATQIPFQGGRRYPASLAGPLYPGGIPIVSEKVLSTLVNEEGVDEVILAYSDLSHQKVMEAASRVLAVGADFRLVGPGRTMLESSLPVISVCAVRTGCGKSPLTRFLCRRLREMARHPVVVRHPMAYGRLDIRAVQEFREVRDLDGYECTLEEREEFEPLIRMGIPLFAGIDYREILARAEEEGDVLLWDGGNNDFPFIRPGLEIVLADPCRPGDEATYYPGLVNLLRARIVVLTKIGEATEDGMRAVGKNLAEFNPEALVVAGDLDLHIDDSALIKGKKVVVVEDGPTLTHGGMAFGAGVVAAHRFGARIVDPRPFAVGSLADTYREFSHLEQVVPAMGYSEAQLEHLKKTLDAVPCDLVLSATPVDLGRLLKLSRPIVRVTYEFREVDGNALEQAVRHFLGAQEGGMNG
jgi:predicted GTPase